jgi:hypothetical protein
MTATWSILTQTTTTSWISLTGGVDDWVDSRLMLLLTETGLNMHAEDDSFLALEAEASPISSSWVPL